MRHAARYLPFLAFFALAAGAACSSSSDSHTQPAAGCAGAPFSCPTGQTCAVANMQLELECLPAGAGAAGASCQNTFGMAACGAGLFCLQAVPSATEPVTPGVCTPFCDSTHTCNSPATCKEAEIVANGLTSPEVSICYSGYPMPDGGTLPPDASSDAPTSSEAGDATPADAQPDASDDAAPDDGATE